MRNPTVCCLFINAGRIVSSMFLSARSDREAIERAKQLSENQRGFDTFEVWDGRRLVYRHDPPATKAISDEKGDRHPGEPI